MAHGSGDLRRAVPAVPASVPLLRGLVAEFATAVGVCEPQLTAIKLAVSEAVTNVVVHAYLGADQPGDVRLVTRIESDAIVVIVSDDGAGLKPRLDSPGLGVGLPFIANCADTLQIGVSDRGGTELRMAFDVVVES